MEKQSQSEKFLKPGTYKESINLCTMRVEYSKEFQAELDKIATEVSDTLQQVNDDISAMVKLKYDNISDLIGVNLSLDKKSETYINKVYKAVDQLQSEIDANAEERTQKAIKFVTTEGELVITNQYTEYDDGTRMFYDYTKQYVLEVGSDIPKIFILPDGTRAKDIDKYHKYPDGREKFKCNGFYYVFAPGDTEATIFVAPNGTQHQLLDWYDQSPDGTQNIITGKGSYHCICDAGSNECRLVE